MEFCMVIGMMIVVLNILAAATAKTLDTGGELEVLYRGDGERVGVLIPPPGKSIAKIKARYETYGRNCRVLYCYNYSNIKVNQYEMAKNIISEISLKEVGNYISVLNLTDKSSIGYRIKEECPPYLKLEVLGESKKEDDGPGEIKNIIGIILRKIIVLPLGCFNFFPMVELEENRVSISWYLDWLML